jgi:hypothetical protein
VFIVLHVKNFFKNLFFQNRTVKSFERNLHTFSTMQGKYKHRYLSCQLLLYKNSWYVWHPCSSGYFSLLIHSTRTTDISHQGKNLLLKTVN